MIHALHGNAGLPEDLLPLLHASGWEFRAWHLWRWIVENPGDLSFDGFSPALNSAAPADASPRILLGYSLGARLALHALTQPSSAWDAAILISPHPGLTDEKERGARLAHDQAWAVRFLRDPWNQVIAAWNAQPTLAGESVSRANQLLVETWRREVAAASDAWSLARQPDLRPRFPRVKCPVLWITGAKDEKFTALARECCPLLPGAQHVIIPAAGHRAYHDDETQAAMSGFLARL